MTGLRIFAPQAIRDVEDAADQFASGRGGVALARRFAMAVAKAGGRVARHPDLGHRRVDLLPDPYRFYPVQGFSYLLIYNPKRDDAPVARVLHMARDLAPLLTDLASGADEPPS